MGHAYGGMGVSVWEEQQGRRLGGRPQTQKGRGTDLLALVTRGGDAGGERPCGGKRGRRPLSTRPLGWRPT